MPAFPLPPFRPPPRSALPACAHVPQFTFNFNSFGLGRNRHTLNPPTAPRDAHPAPNGSAPANSRPPRAPRTPRRRRGGRTTPTSPRAAGTRPGTRSRGSADVSCFTYLFGGEEESARTGRETHLWWHSRGVPGYSPSRIRGSGREEEEEPAARPRGRLARPHPLRSPSLRVCFPPLDFLSSHPRPRPSLPSPLPSSGLSLSSFRHPSLLLDSCPASSALP
jgi:hypothetical protein